ncbi:hypothetical protein OG787_46820 [Streptomyces sp. NBC_00075]|uniref:hypothetical protein n=1 Tax=Streptomyces sp. NBC_00075 TaxID=2975641 RepID=UPI003250AB43
MADEEIRVYDEAVDDVEAAALGRARMADGRRIEVTVEELTRLLATGDGRAPRAGGHGRAENA